MSLATFAAKSYQEHNRARLAHLETLGLDLCEKRVLEVGAGPGDHTGFYTTRDCEVVSTDARAECIELLRARFPRQVTAHVVDMNHPMPDFGAFDIVHCYGLLYHLERPDIAIRSMAAACRGLLLLETCVSMGREPDLNPVLENSQDFSQAFTGCGCRPNRSWVFKELKKSFMFVYLTRTQPKHLEFPLDWTGATTAQFGGLTRSVFVGSRTPLDSRMFSDVLLDRQVHDI